MLRKNSVLAALLGLMSLSACSTEPQDAAAPAAIRSVDSTIESRGIAMPVTLVTPALGAGQRAPLVVMAHGHGGSRQEGGGFKLLAEALAARGIASIRMDFPGCGDSTEPFTNNNLGNMLLDLEAARAYAAGLPTIDGDRLGLLGYSMGGRVAVLAAAQNPGYRAMVAWTPALNDGAVREALEFGGEEAYRELRERARANGMVEYTTRWGTTLQLGYRWFTDLENTRPLESLRSFTGPLLVLYGDQDDVVPPDVSEAAIAAASNSSEVLRRVIKGANHGLGFYTNEPSIAADVVATTASFFSERL